MKRILNIGCGIETYGTHFVDLFPQRPNVIKCDVDKQKLPFQENYFDIVYSKNLFEHLTNLGFAMKEMHRVLKIGGKLVLITDNANFFGFSLGKTHLGSYEKTKLWSKNCKEDKDRHFELFTDWHLQNYAKKYGFKKIKTKYLLEDEKNRNNLIGIKGQGVRFISFLLSNTPLERVAYTLIKLEAIK